MVLRPRCDMIQQALNLDLFVEKGDFKRGGKTLCHTLMNEDVLQFCNHAINECLQKATEIRAIDGLLLHPGYFLFLNCFSSKIKP